MNKTELLNHLNSEYGCKLSEKGLRQILKDLGMSHQRRYLEEDINKVLGAIHNPQNMTGLGRHQPSVTNHQNCHSHDTTDKNENDFLMNVIRKRHAAKSKQLTQAFFESKESYQIFKNIAIEEMGNAWGNKLDGWMAEELRPIKNVSFDETIDVEAQSQGGLPGGNNNGDDDDVEDFHNSPDNN